jgi:casein kinase 1
MTTVKPPKPPVDRSEEVEQILKDLAKLELADRKVLGDRKNIAGAVKKVDAKRETVKKEETIADTESGEIEPIRKAIPKAVRLQRLSKSVSTATDNLELSGIISEFVAVLQSNSSRSLTKEGFVFLDALYKQLASPAGTRRRRLKLDKVQVDEQDTKLGVVARLKREVSVATESQMLAKMVAEFGGVTIKGSGRSVTKDGFGFLIGLAERLKELR